MNSDRNNRRRPPGAQPAPAKLPAAAVVAKAPRGRPRKETLDREADQQALVVAAFGIVGEAGVAALTARAVAARAGTAVGSVYAAFPSLEALRLRVNTATMSLLRDALAAALAQSANRPLDDRLHGLADAYMGFADSQPTLWAALFEPRTMPAPPAMADLTASLFALLEGVLHEAGCAAPNVPALGRALWAAVHGTVFLANHGSLGPVEREDAAALVHTLVNAIVGGIPRQPRTAQAATLLTATTGATPPKP